MKKYITLFILTLILIGITLFSLHIANEKESELAGDEFYKVIFSGADVEPLLSNKSNWKYLAKFEYAAKNPKSLDAISTYASLANDEKAPNVLRELAQYLKVMSSLHTNKIDLDSEKLKEIRVYPYSAKEATAVIKIYNGDIKGAIAILRSLLEDKDCPNAIKFNAQELLQIYEN